MSSTAKVLAASLAIVLATALAAVPAGAAEPASPAVDTIPGAEQHPAHGRVLNGHVFMPADDVPGALITTSFASALLVGLGSTSATWTVGDKTLSGTFDYAAIGAVLGYEYAFFDNLSARVWLTELIFSGTTGRSAVVIGSSLQGGAGAGATFSLPIGDTLRVGALFDVSFKPNVGLTLGTAIKDVINSCESPDGCDVDASSAFEQKNVLELRPALAANWAPMAALGFTANMAYVYADQTVNGRQFNGNAIALAAATDFDFKAISRVPIGLQVQFSWTAPTGSDSGLQHVTDLGGGVFYTGRQDLALGVQLIARRFAVTPDVNVSWKTYVANIGMRYYW